jgi:signal transduction histidine kinase
VQNKLGLAARQREELLAIVSHDLRNPLNAISIAVDELASGDLEPGTRAQYLAAIRRSILRANRLISDLLDAGRIEAGRLVIEARPIAVKALLEHTARELEVLARDAGCSLVVEVAGGVDRALADRDRVGQALGNLVSNACRHARRSGAITLYARPDDDGRIRVGVADRGPGVPAEVLPRVFDRYYQADRQGRAGAGLGLAIVKGIAEAHGGKAWAANRDGGGADFCISLPSAVA